LMVCDPELIKQILVKDFSHFTDRYNASDIHDTLGFYSIFSLKNPLWKTIRGKLSPFFSSGKMKLMFYLVDNASSELINYINKKVDENGKVELEMKNLASLYTTDSMASCIFGVQANSLQNPDGEFRRAGMAIFNPTLYRSIEFTSFFLLPQHMKLFRFQAFSATTSDFVKSTIPEVMNERKKSGEKRHDLIDIFIELENEIDKEILMAQAMSFLSAGEF
jgi:cytochrome P450 family 6